MAPPPGAMLPDNSAVFSRNPLGEGVAAVSGSDYDGDLPQFAEEHQPASCFNCRGIAL